MRMEYILINIVTIFKSLCHSNFSFNFQNFYGRVMENVIKFEIIQILCINNSFVQEIKKKNLLKVYLFNFSK